MSKVYSERIRVTEPETLVLRTGARPHGNEGNALASRTSYSDRTGSEELLLRCLSASREPTAASREPTTDWNEVVAMAFSHGLAPLFFKRLKQSDAWAHIPADTWERLRLAYIANAGRNIRLYRELGPVLRCLRSSGIPMIVLKGAYLAEAVCGDVALRPMADVDLMVPRAELPRAHVVLLDMGRAHQQPSATRDRSLPPRPEDTKRVTGHGSRITSCEHTLAGSIPVSGPDGNAPRSLDVPVRTSPFPLSPSHLGVLGDLGGSIPVSGQSEDIEPRFRRSSELRLSVGAGIDLCWTIVVPKGRFRLDLTGLWDRARPATIAGVEVLALSPEDLLLHLCLHASVSHGLGIGLRPFCDIAETIHRFCGEIDWTELVDRAREWGATRHVGLTLHLARSILGAGVPDDVLERLVPGGIDQRILETARESVLAQTGYDERMPLFDRLGVDSLGDKAKVFRERVFLSRGEMAAVYPASRDSRHFYFYYALRLRDVIRTLGSHTLRRGRLMMRSRGLDPKASLVNWLRSGKP